MHKNSIKLSFCVGVYNEEKIILQAIKKIDENLRKILGLNMYEIVIVDNGSTDNTATLIRKIEKDNLRFFSIKEKAHGLALKIAIEKSKYEYIELTGIDVPFGFDDLLAALTLFTQYDIIFGSKGHPKSKVYSGVSRKASSWIYRFLLKSLFRVGIRDTQGSVFLKKGKILPILKYCNCKNAFFTSEIAIYGNLLKLKITEIPVYSKPQKRKSKYKIIKDGKKMLGSMIKEYFYYRKLKNAAKS